MATLQLSFVMSKNGQIVREQTLSQGVIKIGKVASAHLCVDDELVSRMHAIIEVLGDQVSLIDLGSTSGTFVNGQKITKATLRSGDSITLGASRIDVAFRAAATALLVAPPLVAPPPLVSAPMSNANREGAAGRSPVGSMAVAPVAATPAPFASNALDPGGGARAVEVAAMLGDSVITVKHCSDPRGGKVTRATWAFAAGGLACLLASATAFYVSVDTAARNERDLSAHLAQHKPQRAFRPTQIGQAVDVIALGGLAAGLVGLTAALARTRRERNSPMFRIGTAADVELPIENAPTPSFPLVAPRGDDFVFNYGDGIDGEVIVDGTATPFRDLAAQGRARSSPTIAGAIEVPITANARIRARSGGTTFVISAVAAPRRSAVPLFQIERRTLAYAAGSLAAHLGIVWLLGKIPIDNSGVNVDMALFEGTLARSSNTTSEEPPPEKLNETERGEDSGSQGPGATMALAEGLAGTPKAQQADGRIRIQNNNTEPQLARDEAIKAARIAGVLGSTEAIYRGITALTSTADLSSGMDDANLYAGLTGSEGESHGNYGYGRRNWGPGGGCMREPCGTVGTGRYATIGPGGPRRGDGYSPGGGGGWDTGTRTPKTPGPVLDPPKIYGGLDKAIIKRYIMRHVHKISYCYESELLAHPGLQGSVMVNFMISSSGTVVSSGANGFDGKVSSCVAGVIKNIEFPRPTDGGTVQVNYPFTFHATGT